VTRKRSYLLARLGAFTVLVAAATLLPRGVPAALLVVAAGVVAVVSSLWANAGGPGERAGARPQDRWFDSVMPPQGDWPPYDEPAGQREATQRTPPAS
jgi:hypothetical protein